MSCLLHWHLNEFIHRDNGQWRAKQESYVTCTMYTHMYVYDTRAHTHTHKRLVMSKEWVLKPYVCTMASGYV